MDDNKSRETTPHGDAFGAPRKFSYPPPPSFTEEELRRYAEMGKRVDDIIAKMKRRSRGRRR
jgi:hypothetical protein